MAINFHHLPVDAFPVAARPKVARLNRELRDLFGLEGVLRHTGSGSRRSDASVARQRTSEFASTVSANGNDITFGAGFGPVLIRDKSGVLTKVRLDAVWDSTAGSAGTGAWAFRLVDLGPA